MKRVARLLLLLFLVAAPLLADTVSRELELPGEPALGATLEMPAVRTGEIPGVVLMHGSGPQDRDCTMPIGLTGIHPFRRFSSELSKRGFAVLRYDKRSYALRGSKDPQKDILSLTPEQFIDDAALACRILAAQPEVDSTRIFLLGHSQGGTFAPYVAQRCELAGLVMLAPGVLPFRKQVEYQLNYQLKILQEQNTLGVMAPTIAKTKDILKQYKQLFKTLDDPGLSEDKVVGGATVRFYRQYDRLSEGFVEAVKELELPALIVNGDADLKCPKELLEKLAPELKEKSDLKIVYREGTSHEFYRNKYLTFDAGAAEAVADWMAGVTRLTELK